MESNILFSIVIIVVIIIISFIIWWICRSYRKGNWKLTKVRVKTGPADFEYTPDDSKNVKSRRSTGVFFGLRNVFKGTKIKKVIGQDDIHGSREKTSCSTSGVDFGKDNDFTSAEIEGIIARDKIVK